MRTSRWLTIGTALIAFISGVVAAAQLVGPTTRPEWFRDFVLHHQGALPFIAIALAGAIFLAQITQAVIGPYRYRKTTVQDIVDGLPNVLSGQARRNRITIFRRVKGWKALAIGVWRLRYRPWREPKQAKFRALCSLSLAGDYLFPYVRSSEGRNERCVAVFQVGELERDCHGMAGRTWEEGFMIRAELPKLKDSYRDDAATLNIEEVRNRHPNDPLRKYVTETWIVTTEQMQALQTFARHFMGQAIYTGGKRPWGVILLDSDEEECPFDAASQDGGTFGEVLRTHGTTLGHILR